jgi:hypothetical protein
MYSVVKYQDLPTITTVENKTFSQEGFISDRNLKPVFRASS